MRGANNASGVLSTSLILTADIANNQITFDKLDSNLVLPFNTTLSNSSVNNSDQAIVTKKFMADSIKPFTQNLQNIQPNDSDIFLHITNNLLNTSVPGVLPFYVLGSNVRYIIEIDVSSVDIKLPTIDKEGLRYLIEELGIKPSWNQLKKIETSFGEYLSDLAAYYFE